MGPSLSIAVAVLALLLGSCAGREEPVEEGAAMSLQVTSPAFAAGARIPRKFTGEGEDVSPALRWSAVPAGTREIALICDDPDAPVGTWDHWIVTAIPAAATGLEEGRLPEGARTGRNSWGKSRYGGPMPPPGHGDHRYFFRVYALDAPLGLPEGATKQAVLAAVKGHVLAKGELMGKYSR